MAGENALTWQLSSGQFAALWDTSNTDSLPYPLHYRPGGRTGDSALAALEYLAQWSRNLNDDPLRTCIDVLNRSELAVSLYVTDSPAARPTFQRRAAIRGQISVMADQEPDRDLAAIPDGATITGDITVKANRGRANTPDLTWLTTELLAGIPDTKPGRNKQLSAHPADLKTPEHTPSSSVLQQAITTEAEVLRALLAKRGPGGYIIIHGPRVGREDTILDSLMWLDIPGDGRYLHTEDDKITVRAARLPDVARELERRIHRILEPHSA